MPEENQVTADLGTGEIVQETPAVVTEGEQVQTEASQEQMSERERALVQPGDITRGMETEEEVPQ